MSNLVFVIDTEKRPLLPVHPGKARRLLNAPKAAVFRREPFTIILKVMIVTATPESITFKIDPGYQTTGIALVQGEKVILGAELTHRGQSLKTTLESRSELPRSRINPHTPYRQASFLNRTRPKGGLAPSLQHLAEKTLTWVKILNRIEPIRSIRFNRSRACPI
ncbi:RRXRR domain-containing protein [Microcoleus sp. herbarium2]